jgi:hypothetical protein
MLESGTFRIDGKPADFDGEVRATENVPRAIEHWMARVAYDLLQLAVYFRAVLIWHRVPGVDQYKYLVYDDNNKNAPNDEDDPNHWLSELDRSEILNVLAECLRRLGDEDLIKEVPGGQTFEPEELSEDWIEYLNRQAKFENGLLSVVARCLDGLLVYPGIAEIGDVPKPTWWQQWWARME